MSSTERFYGYICIAPFSKQFPDELITFEKDKNYPARIVAGLNRGERERYFVRNKARGGDVQAKA